MRRMLKKCIGIMFLIAGILIFLYPDFREWKLKEEIATIVESVQEDTAAEGKWNQSSERKEKSETVVIEPENAEVQEEDVNFAENTDTNDLLQILREYNHRLLTEGQIISENSRFDQTLAEITSWAYDSQAIGYINIPDISLELPLYIGATEANMSSGAVVLSGTSMPIGGTGSNCVIAAHRGWSGSAYFRDIDKLSIGSVVNIHNLWETLSYQVTGTSIIYETEDEILRVQPEKDMLTLFSCYPYMSVGTPYRLVVFCERLQETAETVDETESMLQPQEEISVRKMIDEELEDKGIVIEEAFTEELSEKEDMARVVLPLVCVSLFLITLLFRLKSKK